MLKPNIAFGIFEILQYDLTSKKWFFIKDPSYSMKFHWTSIKEQVVNKGVCWPKFCNVNIWLRNALGRKSM